MLRNLRNFPTNLRPYYQKLHNAKKVVVPTFTWSNEA